MNPIPCVPFSLGIWLRGRGELERGAAPLFNAPQAGVRGEKLPD